MTSSYTPSQDLLEKYALLLVNFALGGGKGIKPGETVYLQSYISALPLYAAIYKQIINSGGTVISSLMDDTQGLQKHLLTTASDDQLSKFYPNYLEGLVKDIDHRFFVLSQHDVHELKGVDSQKSLIVQKALLPYRKWLDEKENAGRYTWSLALYGTESMAQEAGLSLEEYWQQIIKACYLDEADPIAKWKQIYSEIEHNRQALTGLKIQKVHVESEDADLFIKIGSDRQWLGGGGRNMPSFEIFTSPDWRGTEGWIKFNQPVFKYDMMAKDVRLEFKSGRVVNSSASDNAQFIEQLVKTDQGAAQLGEFSLTDKRLSRIDRFMAETLFDENIGGEFGNTHIALGKSFAESFIEGASGMNDEKAASLGLNDSSIHVDMVSTVNRRVTAYLEDKSTKVIYENGQFLV